MGIPSFDEKLIEPLPERVRNFDEVDSNADEDNATTKKRGRGKVQMPDGEYYKKNVMEVRGLRNKIKNDTTLD